MKKSTVARKKRCSITGCRKSVWHGRSTKCESHRFACVVPDCELTTLRPGRERQHSNGAYCQFHRNRVTKHGDPYKDASRIAQWRIHPDGYVYKGVTKNGKHVKRIYQHREVMEAYLGRKLVKGENVHHLNGVRSDNRIENLELWVSHQPAGQRPADLVAWAREILERYGDQNQ